jgi:hypothetical protein
MGEITQSFGLRLQEELNRKIEGKSGFGFIENGQEISFCETYSKTFYCGNFG